MGQACAPASDGGNALRDAQRNLVPFGTTTTQDDCTTNLTENYSGWTDYTTRDAAGPATGPGARPGPARTQGGAHHVPGRAGVCTPTRAPPGGPGADLVELFVVVR